MVRFIIFSVYVFLFFIFVFTFQYGQIYYLVLDCVSNRETSIYIPIWLDLLFACGLNNICRLFIYIPIWLDLLLTNIKRLQTSNIYLHSNMVRFIIIVIPFLSYSAYKFTFQYGQIYYIFDTIKYFIFFFIYIPIWLDLLSPIFLIIVFFELYLHSNMVRFIINK